MEKLLRKDSILWYLILSLRWCCRPLTCMDELWDVQLLHVHLDEVHQHLWLVPAEYMPCWKISIFNTRKPCWGDVELHFRGGVKETQIFFTFPTRFSSVLASKSQKPGPSPIICSAIQAGHFAYIVASSVYMPTWAPLDNIHSTWKWSKGMIRNCIVQAWECLKSNVHCLSTTVNTVNTVNGSPKAQIFRYSQLRWSCRTSACSAVGQGPTGSCDPPAEARWSVD